MLATAVKERDQAREQVSGRSAEAARAAKDREQVRAGGGAVDGQCGILPSYNSCYERDKRMA